MLGGGQADAAAMLTQADERLQKVKVGPSTVLLSALDTFRVGGSADVKADWKTHNPRELLYVFAETLAIEGTFAASGGTVSANAILTTGAPVFDVSGPVGETPLPQPGSSAAPSAGQDGGAGGAFSLFVANFDPPFNAPRILAHGGQGGGGQPGDTARDGGDGGNGGKGGSVVALLTHPAYQWLASLRAAYALTDVVAKQRAITQLLAEIPDTTTPAWLSAVRAQLGAVVSGTPTTDQVNSALHSAGLELGVWVDTWKTQLVAMIDVSGGAAGPVGVGKSDGKPGAPGEAGKSTVVVVGAADAPGADVRAACFVHPSQCAMVLAKAKLAFLFLDPIKDASQVADTVTLLDRVRARTEPFVTLKDDSDLAKAYATNEASLGAVNSVATLRSINAEAKKYLSFVKKGLDFFGYSSDYVPLTSVDKLARDAVTPLLDAFKSVEQAYTEQFAQLRRDKQTLDHVKESRDQLEVMTQQAKVDLPELLNALASASAIIDGFQSVLPAKKKAALDALAAYQGDLEQYFGFDWQVMLGALGQCAFAPESGAMWAIQASSVVYSGSVNVTDVQGQPVRKALLVQQMKAIEASVDGLLEGFEVLDDGTVGLDDPGASKLLAAERQIESLLSQFYDKFPGDGDALRTAIEDYVNAVVARNNQVLTYNAALTLIVQYQRVQQDAQAQARQLNDQVLESIAADAPGLTSFVSQAYYRARDRVLEFMDLAARAYRFWALQDEDLLRANLGPLPPKITSMWLEQIQANVWGTYTLAIGNVGGMQQFPAQEREGACLRRDRARHQRLQADPPASGRGAALDEHDDDRTVRQPGQRATDGGARLREGRQDHERRSQADGHTHRQREDRQLEQQGLQLPAQRDSQGLPLRDSQE